MYGCIEVMKRIATHIAEELLTERVNVEPDYCDIGENPDWSKEALNKAESAKEKMDVLSRLLRVYFAQKNYLEIFFLLEKLLNEPLMANHKAYLLFQKGRVSECLYEFDDALIYYCRCLTCPIVPDEIYYDLWNNMGFCWLYKQDFKSAEICCRRAIELNPNRWEAWKNLRICLKHKEC